MLIGEVAQRAGVTKDTVRLYTRVGLVPSTVRAAGTRDYADYDNDAGELVRNIKIAQSLGFTLAEIKPIARAYTSGTLGSEHQHAVLTSKLAELQEKRRQLGRMINTIQRKLDALGDSGPDSPGRE